MRDDRPILHDACLAVWPRSAQIGVGVCVVGIQIDALTIAFTGAIQVAHHLPQIAHLKTGVGIRWIHGNGLFQRFLCLSRVSQLQIGDAKLEVVFCGSGF